MAQKTVTLTATPQAVATGIGNAMFQGQHSKVSYWVATSTPDPTLIPPFIAEIGVREPMALASGETLYLAGSSTVVVYAEVEPV